MANHGEAVAVSRCWGGRLTA